MKIFLYENRDDVYIDVYYPDGMDVENAARSERPLPAVIICPGGGYHIIGSTEGRPVSDKFTEAGYAAFILHYTIGEAAVFGPGGFREFAPVCDLDAAMRLLHENAATYGIDPERFVLAGFSAGGHLCAAWCFSQDFTGSGLLPQALILTYPMGGGPDSGGEGKEQPAFDVARMPYTDDPAAKNLRTFLWHAKDDGMVSFSVSERLAARLEEEGIPCTFRVYEHGVHARPFYDPDWFCKALDWLAAQ